MKRRKECISVWYHQASPSALEVRMRRQQRPELSTLSLLYMHKNANFQMGLDKNTTFLID